MPKPAHQPKAKRERQEFRDRKYNVTFRSEVECKAVMALDEIGAEQMVIATHPHMKIVTMRVRRRGFDTGFYTVPRGPKPSQYTPSGFDPAWLSVINGVLEDRESDIRITDVTQVMWDAHIGPLIDAIEAGDYPDADGGAILKGGE